MPERNPAQELAERIWDAHVAMLARKGRASVTQARIASEVSRLAGIPVDQTTVGTWLKKEGTKPTVPKPWFLHPLADFYGVRFPWLLENEGPMFAAVAKEAPPPRGAEVKQTRKPVVAKKDKKRNPRKAGGDS